MTDHKKNGDTINDLSDTIGGTPRAMKRPAHLDLKRPFPANTAVPAPEAAEDKYEQAHLDDNDRAPRTGYGDWEREGFAWDF